MAKRVSDSSYQYGEWTILFVRGSQYTYGQHAGSFSRRVLNCNLAMCSHYTQREHLMCTYSHACDVAAMFEVDTRYS